MLLTATRWLPVGIVFGLTILLPRERGLSLSQIGVLIAVQGFVVLALELPTGGLADSIGRRPLLVVAALVGLVSTLLFVAADTFWLFAVAMMLHGVFRALDSGPLESWYVDASIRADPTAPIERGLAWASTTLGAATAVGALLGGAIVFWDPIPDWSALAFPFVIAAAVKLVHTVLTVLLITEDRPDRPAERPRGLASSAALLAMLRTTPTTILDGVRMLRTQRTLRALVLVEVFWCVAMIAFETLTPVSLADFLGSTVEAGALFGPVSALAWALFAGGSVLAGVTSRRLGVAGTAIAARILNGLFVIGMGLAAGVVGLIAAYWLAYLTHGAGGPVHQTLLHRQAQSHNRTVVLSINSMVGGGAYTLGVLVLAPFAEATTTGVALIVAGAFSILGAVCYLPALREERRGSSPREQCEVAGGPAQ